MSVNTKGKRRLTVRHQTYYWYVAPDCDAPALNGKMMKLHISAEDQTWHTCFPLDSCLRPEERYAQYAAPIPLPDAVTPEIVRQIIELQRPEIESRSK